MEEKEILGRVDPDGKFQRFSEEKIYQRGYRQTQRNLTDRGHRIAFETRADRDPKSEKVYSTAEAAFAETI